MAIIRMLDILKVEWTNLRFQVGKEVFLKVGPRS